MAGRLIRARLFLQHGSAGNINDLSATNAYSLDSALLPYNVVSAIPNPHERTNLTPRIDWAPTKNNTVTLRYQYYRDTENNQLGNALDLPTQAYYTQSTENTVQVSDTQVIGSKIINELRFQYLRDDSMQTAANTTPTVTVLGNFTGGGYASGNQNDAQNGYEIQNYTSLIHSNHSLKFGARVRLTQDTNYSTSGFNGTFTFSSLGSSATPDSGIPSNCATFAQNPPCPISYYYAQQQFNGGAAAAYATQLTYTTGNPTAQLTYYDVEPYIQDDWRVKPNLTISSGLRFEAQNDIHDHADWAPRFGFAWGVGGRSAPPKVVIRGGYGIFYDRFQITQLLQAERLNGVTQQQFIIDNPTCFPGIDVALSSFGNCGPVLRQVQYLSDQPEITRSLHHAGSTRGRTATYQIGNPLGHLPEFSRLRSVRSHQCERSLSRDALCSKLSPIRGGNIYRYVSEANFKQNQLMMNSNVRIGSKVQLFGYYSLNYANSDASGVSSLCVQLLQHPAGLRARVVRYSPQRVSWRQHLVAVSVSPESVHGDQFRLSF